MVTAACGATATNIVMKRLGLINLSQPTQRPGVMCMLFYIFIIIIILNFGGVWGFSCLLFVFVPLSLKTVRGLLEFPLATCCSMEFLMSLCYIAMHIFFPSPLSSFLCCMLCIICHFACIIYGLCVVVFQGS